MVALGGMAISYERGTPVHTRVMFSCVLTMFNTPPAPAPQLTAVEPPSCCPHTPPSTVPEFSKAVLRHEYNTAELQGYLAHGAPPPPPSNL